VILALILNEKHLWRLVEQSGETVSEADRQAVTEFFQKHTYYTGRGYEEALAESSRLIRKGAPESTHVFSTGNEQRGKAGVNAKEEQEQEISRGGQVGEHGG
jgi:hypothetical protein